MLKSGGGNTDYNKANSFNLFFFLTTKDMYTVLGYKVVLGKTGSRRIFSKTVFDF